MLYTVQDDDNCGFLSQWNIRLGEHREREAGKKQ